MVSPSHAQYLKDRIAGSRLTGSHGGREALATGKTLKGSQRFSGDVCVIESS